MAKHAEIAGAGLAGLGIGIGLASHGWTVRIHERAPAVREVGAGIFLSQNAQLVLDEYGVLDELRELGVRLERHAMFDGHGRELQHRDLAGPGQLLTIPRQILIDRLHACAVASGAEVVTDSPVLGADPRGALRLEVGDAPADLVIGADGYLSAVRNSLGLTRHQESLPTVSVRYLLEGRELVPRPESRQYWSGRRRMAITAAAEDRTYVYLSCPSGDPAESQAPGWADDWAQSFPVNAQVFETLAAQRPYIANYGLVKARSWCKGRVALIGDAAHALPPTLGQGACLGLVNARSLVTYVDDGRAPVEQRLAEWERHVRSLTDFTQRWSCWYDQATTHCPDALAVVRTAVIMGFGRIRSLDRHMRRAGRTPPVRALA